MRALVLLALVAVGQACSNTTTVSLASGTLEGCELAGHKQFFGIPFAEPPVGSLRWQAPVPKSAWSGVLDATAFRPACPQAANGIRQPGLAMDEDCLYLNVWTPVTAGKWPVYVYIHGGGFFEGTGADPMFYGDWFANSTNTILVTLNYRLGALGWFNSIDAGVGGNFGLFDQQLAFKWVQDNIAAFGGDPGRVTIGGQSAGAMSVFTHLLVPSSFTYYSAAIMESNPAAVRYRKPAENEVFATTLAKNLNCTASDLSCFMSKTYEQIIAVDLVAEYIHPYPHGLATNMFLPWMPVVDGVVLPDYPMNLVRQGKFNNVPMIMGTVQNETTGFLKIFDGAGDTIYDLLVGLVFNGNTTVQMAVEAEYAPANKDAIVQMRQFTTDFLFVCPTRFVANTFAQQDTNVYLYHFLHDPVQDFGTNPDCTNSFAACHSAELPYVFHSAAPMNITQTGPEQQLSWTMLNSWAGFVSTHDPPSSPINWPTVNDGGSATTTSMLFNLQSAIGTNYDQNHCDFWDAIGYNF